MEKKRAGVRRGGGREAQHDLLRLLLEHAERALGVGLQVEIRRRRAGLLEDFEAMDRIEAEQRRRRPALDAGDQVGARPEQQAVGDDLAPARRAPIVELDHEPRKQRLAQPRQHGRIGERARADLARQSLGAKLRLDVDAEAPPVGFAQAGADLGVERAQARGAAFVPRRFEGAGGVFELGQFLGRRGGREIAEPARGEAKPRLPSVVLAFERPERRLDRIPHPLRRPPRRVDKRRHLVERQAVEIAREGAGEGEDGEGFLVAHGTADPERARKSL